MGLIGNLLSLPVRVLNIPARVMEDLTDTDDDDRILSKPLDVLANEVEKVDESKGD